MRRAARIDANHKEIVEAFRALGATVENTQAMHGGFPDIVVGYAGINVLVEIKDGEKSASKQKLTPDQVIWHGNWRGYAVIVNCVDDVQHLINQIREWSNTLSRHSNQWSE